MVSNIKANYLLRGLEILDIAEDNDDRRNKTSSETRDYHGRSSSKFTLQICFKDSKISREVQEVCVKSKDFYGDNFLHPIHPKE